MRSCKQSKFGRRLCQVPARNSIRTNPSDVWIRPQAFRDRIDAIAVAGMQRRFLNKTKARPLEAFRHSNRR
ncbi:hypothetical protein MesoLj113b_49400 [Mesorhizobium sp. 113-3-3]|nr:hypothetical protein MesoLj113b_49400 [Mesorhizobium sp. 113-3-3]